MPPRPEPYILGANLMSFKYPRDENLNANDCTASGWYYMPSDSYEGKNIPIGYFAFCAINYGTSDLLQVGFGIVARRAFFRCKTGPNWSDWYEFSKVQ